MDQIDMTFETLPPIKPYGERDSNVMFDPLGLAVTQHNLTDAHSLAGML